MEIKLLAQLFVLQSHPLYRIHAHEWIYEIKIQGIQAWLEQNQDSYLHENIQRLLYVQMVIEKWVQEPLQKCVGLFDSDFPSSFLSLERPPLVIFYRGHAFWKRLPLLSVVGSREIRPFSSDWMESELKQFITGFKSQVGVVSGGARGVDLKSHQISLRTQAPTLAILPSGLSNIYPADFVTWGEDIVRRGGALMSEYLPHEEMRKQHFEARNRLIAALGALTLIVQGQKRSGSMLTAKQCIQNHKVVAIIPGHPTDPAFSGNLNLLREGAFPVMDAQDLTLLFKAENGLFFNDA